MSFLTAVVETSTEEQVVSPYVRVLSRGLEKTPDVCGEFCKQRGGRWVFLGSVRGNVTEEATASASSQLLWRPGSRECLEPGGSASIKTKPSCMDGGGG